MDILSVSQLNRYVKSKLEEDFRLKDLFLQGEISNIKKHLSSGHVYFTLKDEKASIQAVMWRSSAQRLIFKPEDGMSVIVRCTVSLYEANGSYQIYVTDMQPNGAGQLYIAYRQTVERLSAIGLFDESHKKRLPEYPENVVVITSPTGAVIQDIINVTKRRYPCCNLIIAPCNVQGKGASATIISALQRVDRLKIADVIIIARGGGSLEDLWEYNNEELANAIFVCETPVVSAVGHETDYTICDMVSDLRAPTPSAAAELVFPSINDIKFQVFSHKKHIDDSMAATLKRCSDIANNAKANYGIARFQEYVGNQKISIDGLEKSIKKYMENAIASKAEYILMRTKLAEEQSPLRILSKGYSITMKDERAITSADSLEIGDELVTTFASGKVRSKIIDKTK